MFKFKHRNIKSKWDVSRSFPDLTIINAYTNPPVDRSRTTFSWADVDIPGIVSFMETKLGWHHSQTNRLLLPVLKRGDMTNQTRLLHLYGPTGRFSQVKSKRMQEALRTMASTGLGTAARSGAAVSEAHIRGLRADEVAGEASGDEDSNKIGYNDIGSNDIGAVDLSGDVVLDANMSEEALLMRQQQAMEADLLADMEHHIDEARALMSDSIVSGYVGPFGFDVDGLADPFEAAVAVESSDDEITMRLRPTATSIAPKIAPMVAPKAAPAIASKAKTAKMSVSSGAQEKKRRSKRKRVFGSDSEDE